MLDLKPTDNPSFLGSDFILPAILAGLGSILGGASGGRQKQKNTEEELALRRDELEMQRYLAGLEAPGKRLRTAGRANMIKNYSPTKGTFGGPGSGSYRVTGGYSNPDLIDPSFRALGADVLNDQYAQQTGYDKVDFTRAIEGNPWMNRMLKKNPALQEKLNAAEARENARRSYYSGGPPPLHEQRGDSFFDKLLGGGAVGSSLLAGILGPRTPNRTTQFSPDVGTASRYYIEPGFTPDEAADFYLNGGR